MAAWACPGLDGFVPEQLAFNVKLRRAGETMPAPGAVPAGVIRRNRALGRGGFPTPTIDPDAYDIARDGLLARVFRAENGRATCVHIHGGGWVFGSIHEQDARLRELATEAGIDVVSIQYRLAPEHPFPASVEDCAATIVALADGWEGLCRDRILISGESAGAHLAVAALLRLRGRPDIVSRCAGASLCFGCYDLSMTPSQRLWGEQPLGLSTPILRWLRDQFLAGMTDEGRRHPDVSPLFADLSGLPLALFSVGSADPLLDDSLFMAARWKAAGNCCELAVYPEAPHGFIAQPTAMARAGNERIYRFLRTCAAGEPFER